MNKEGYTIFSQEPNLYSFVSSGKNGEIVKAVAFVELLPNTFNLALLDYDADTKSWSDLASTNNGDMPKVMTTVVAIIHESIHRVRFILRQILTQETISTTES
jgi:hypothetical protein